MAPRQSSRIYQQIEATADYHDPSLYARLGAFDVSAVDDPDANDFIPLTATKKLPSEETRIFVIGLLPPSVNLTLKLLNRSATIQSLYGGAQSVDVETREFQNPSQAAQSASSGSGAYITTPGVRLPTPTGGDPALRGVGYTSSGNSNGEVPIVTKLTKEQVYRAMYDAWVRRYKTEPTPNQILLVATQTWRETSGQWPNNNPGMIGNFPDSKHPPTAWSTRHITAGGDRQWYVSYDSVEAGADAMLAHATRGTALQALQDGDTLGYTTSLAATGYFGATVKIYHDRSIPIYNEMASAVSRSGGPVWPPFSIAQAPDTCAFRETQTEYQTRVGCKNGHCPDGVDPQRLKVSGETRSDNTGCEVFGGTVESSVTEWSTSGSDNASKAAEEASIRNNNTIPEALAMAQSLEEAQKGTIQALAAAIKQMAETPPLRLLVNPESFKVAEEKVISDGNWTRAGPIVEHWGENQPTVSASGKLAGFYALDVSNTGAGSSGNSPGLTRAARNFSAAYQNFLSLYFIYKNNGAIYLPDSFTGNEARKVLAMLGSVYIYYDNILYIGSFSSLNVQETDDKPYTLQYDFEFTIRAKWLLDRQIDPQREYGNKGIFAENLGTIPTSEIQFTPADSSVIGDVEVPLSQTAINRYDKEVADAAFLSPTQAEMYRGPTSLDSEDTKEKWIRAYTVQERTGVVTPPIIEPPVTPPTWGKIPAAGTPDPLDSSSSPAIATARSNTRVVSSKSIPYRSS